MRSLNEIIRRIKDVADRHQLINTVVTDEKFEQENYNLYPLMHIVAGPWGLQGNKVVNRFILLCMDIGSEDGTNRYDNLSDTQLVLTDVITELQKSSADLDTPYLEFETSGDATKIIDGKGDNASGWLIEIICSQQYERNNCELPITP